MNSQKNINRLKIVVLTMITICIAFNVNANTKNYKKRSNTKRVTTARVDLARVRTKSVTFGFDKAKVNPDYYPELNRVAKLMSDNNAAVKLGGHADNVGAYVYNWKLSESRANAVKDYLVNKGIDSSRVAATGFGDTKPIASNKTKSGRLKNRRVDIQFAQ